MAWFGGGGFGGMMGGLGDRLLSGRGLPSGNPYTGGTGGAYGRGGSGSAFGGYGGGEGSLSADNRALAAYRGGGYPPMRQGGGPIYGTQPVGPQPVGPRPVPMQPDNLWGRARPTGRGF